MTVVRSYVLSLLVTTVITILAISWIDSLSSTRVQTFVNQQLIPQLSAKLKEDWVTSPHRQIQQNLQNVLVENYSLWQAYPELTDIRLLSIGPINLETESTATQPKRHPMTLEGQTITLTTNEPSIFPKGSYLFWLAVLFTGCLSGLVWVKYLRPYSVAQRAAFDNGLTIRDLDNTDIKSCFENPHTDLAVLVELIKYNSKSKQAINISLSRNKSSNFRLGLAKRWSVDLLLYVCELTDVKLTSGFFTPSQKAWLTLLIKHSHVSDGGLKRYFYQGQPIQFSENTQESSFWIGPIAIKMEPAVFATYKYIAQCSTSNIMVNKPAANCKEDVHSLSREIMIIYSDLIGSRVKPIDDTSFADNLSQNAAHANKVIRQALEEESLYEHYIIKSKGGKNKKSYFIDVG